MNVAIGGVIQPTYAILTFHQPSLLVLALLRNGVRMEGSVSPASAPQGLGSPEATSQGQDVQAEEREQPGSAELVQASVTGMLLPFQRALLNELLDQDGLCVLAAGLGVVQVVAVLLRLQEARWREAGQQGGVVLVIGGSPWQCDALQRELARINRLLGQHADALGPGAAPGVPLPAATLLFPRRCLAGCGCCLEQAALPVPVTCEAQNAALQAAFTCPLPPAHAPFTPCAAAYEPPVELSNEVPAADRTTLYQTRSCLFVTTRILVVDMLSSRVRPPDIAATVVLNAHRWVGGMTGRGGGAAWGGGGLHVRRG